MLIAEFNAAISYIDYQIKLIHSIEKCQPFLDGAINIEKYLASELKIMWILKEPNSTEQGLNWRDEIRDLKTNAGIQSGWANTFAPIVYTTFGIVNSKNWNDIPDHRKDPSIIDVLNEIAFINLKKTAGTSVANKSFLKEFHANHKSLVISQLALYDPEVIICGSTFEILGPDLVYADLIMEQQYGVTYYYNKDIIILDVYHPNNRVKGLGQEKYCNGIIDIVSKWKTTNKKPSATIKSYG